MPGMDAGDAPAPDAPGDKVVCTISKNADGTYTVYAGDEPDDSGAGDASQDDVNAMGGGGDQPAGQPADSIGAALKAAMDILQADASGGGGGGAEAAFMAAGGGSGAPAGGAAPPAPIRTKMPMPPRKGMA